MISTVKRNYWAVCGVCGQMYKNWSGSTPCCGALAWIKTEKDFRNDKIKVIMNNIKKL